LLSRNLFDVLAQLLLAFARIARRSLGFDYSQDGAVGVVETKIGEAVPRGWIVALYRHFKLNLQMITELPPRFLQLGIYQ